MNEDNSPTSKTHVKKSVVKNVKAMKHPNIHNNRWNKIICSLHILFIYVEVCRTCSLAYPSSIFLMVSAGTAISVELRIGSVRYAGSAEWVSRQCNRASLYAVRNMTARPLHCKRRRRRDRRREQRCEQRHRQIKSERKNCSCNPNFSRKQNRREWNPRHRRCRHTFPLSLTIR